MTKYCEICGVELEEDEEEDGICSECKEKFEEDDDEEYKKNEDYIDPGIT